MQLKRIYNHDAPKKEWVSRTGSDGTSQQIPPVTGVEIRRHGGIDSRQKFTPRLVDRGQREGWLSLAGVELTIAGENKTLIYKINRVPGRYDDETINYYDCQLVKEETP